MKPFLTKDGFEKFNELILQHIKDKDDALDTKFQGKFDNLTASEVKYVESTADKEKIDATDTQTAIVNTIKKINSLDGSLAKVAKSGKAVDVSYNGAVEDIAGKNVEQALEKIISDYKDADSTLNSTLGKKIADLTGSNIAYNDEKTKLSSEGNEVKDVQKAIETVVAKAAQSAADMKKAYEDADDKIKDQITTLEDSLKPIATSGKASDASFEVGESGLTSTNAQSALIEINNKFQGKFNDLTASEVKYVDSTEDSEKLGATNTQTAIENTVKKINSLNGDLKAIAKSGNASDVKYDGNTSDISGKNVKEALDTIITNYKAANDTIEGKITDLDTAYKEADSALRNSINNLAKVASTGAAADVAYSNSSIVIGEATTVQKALEVLAGGSGAADKITYANTKLGEDVKNVKQALDVLADGSGDAENIDYNNTTSKLDATNVQDAIDKLAEMGDNSVELTKAEYDALTLAEKNNGTIYYVTDYTPGGGGGGGGTGDNSVQLTQAQYDALTPAEKNNGTTYYITDADDYVASIMDYDNTESGLEADTIQDAIDEIVTKINSQPIAEEVGTVEIDDPAARDADTLGGKYTASNIDSIVSNVSTNTANITAAQSSITSLQSGVSSINSTLGSVPRVSVVETVLVDTPNVDADTLGGVWTVAKLNELEAKVNQLIASLQ